MFILYSFPHTETFHEQTCRRGTPGSAVAIAVDLKIQTPPKQRSRHPETLSRTHCWLGAALLGLPPPAAPGRVSVSPSRPAAEPEGRAAARQPGSGKRWGGTGFRLLCAVPLGQLGTMAALVLLRAGLARPRGAQMGECPPAPRPVALSGPARP